MSGAAIFLSARNKATRLPGKMLLDLAGASVLERLIERLQLAREAVRIVLTTSSHPDDQVLVRLANTMGIKTFCGSEDDKLDRYLQAARSLGAELVAIVDGDDPFCDPGYIDRLFCELRQTGASYARVDGLPVGVTANVVCVSALQRVCELKTERNTEVWAGYFTETGLFQTRLLEADSAHRAPTWRMTLDYPEDYAFFKAVYAELYRPGQVFSLDDIMGLLRRRPDIMALNQGASTKYEANLKRITKIGVNVNTVPGKGVHQW